MNFLLRAYLFLPFVSWAYFIGNDKYNLSERTVHGFFRLLPFVLVYYILRFFCLYFHSYLPSLFFALLLLKYQYSPRLFFGISALWLYSLTHSFFLLYCFFLALNMIFFSKRIKDDKAISSIKQALFSFFNVRR